MIRTRQSWWDFTMNRGTDGSQVHLILMDWKEEQVEFIKTFTDMRAAIREGQLESVDEMLALVISALTCKGGE